MGIVDVPTFTAYLASHWQAVTVTLLTLGAVALFVSELIEIELVAALVTAVLLVTGIVSPRQGLAGFSNPATVTIACMFILSEGLRKTGIVNRFGSLLGEAFETYDFRVAVLGMMALTGALSGVINNTAVVAIFLPVVLNAARESDISSTKALMCLSFSAMFGGVCTLIGTSTNILVSSIIVDSEVLSSPDPIGMFEMAPFGVVCFVAGAIYMLTVGGELTPDREETGDLTESFDIQKYLTELEIRPQERNAYKPARRTYIHEDDDVDILEVERDGKSLRPQEEVALNLQAYDTVRIRGSAEAIRTIAERDGIVVRPNREVSEGDITTGEAELVEAVVAPDGALDCSSLNDFEFDETFNAQILAIRRRGDVIHRNLSDVQLQGGDVLLLQTEHEQLSHLQQHPAFIVISEVGTAPFKPEMILPATLTIAGVIATAAFDILALPTAIIVALLTAAVVATLRLVGGARWIGTRATPALAGLIPLGMALDLSIVVTAFAGAVAMNLTGLLSPQDSYEAVDWQVILLLAGLIPLGTGLENVGGIAVIADQLRALAGAYSPRLLLGAFYLITVLLTGIMSNQATAILFAPLAIQTATELGWNPRPFVMAVTFAASASFLTPVGYQTNTMIYGAGKFEFKDFLKVGTPLTLLFWVLAILLIPMIWPIR